MLVLKGFRGGMALVYLLAELQRAVESQNYSYETEIAKSLLKYEAQGKINNYDIANIILNSEVES